MNSMRFFTKMLLLLAAASVMASCCGIDKKAGNVGDGHPDKPKNAFCPSKNRVRVKLGSKLGSKRGDCVPHTTQNEPKNGYFCRIAPP